MILDKFISIKPSNKNRSYYLYKGYDVSNDINVKIEDLPTFSHYKINVKCDVCGKEKELIYHKYMKNTKMNTIHYSCSQKCSVSKILKTFNENYGCVSSQHPDVKLKQSNTNIKIYGGKSPQCDREIKQKSYDSMIEKYGHKHALQNELSINKFMSKINETTSKTNKTKIERGIMVDYNNYNSFKEYRNLVNIETRKNRKELFLNWDGYDFYDNQYIRENYNLDFKDKSYPSIDHKISVLFGFKNKIDPYEIGKLENLCITTRSNNSIKHSKNSF